MARLTENVFAPAAGKATASVEFIVLLGQANKVDVLSEFDGNAENQDCKVVSQRSSVELFVNYDLADVAVLMREDLGLCLGVPFSGTNFQL